MYHCKTFDNENSLFIMFSLYSSFDWIIFMFNYLISWSGTDIIVTNLCVFEIYSHFFYIKIGKVQSNFFILKNKKILFPMTSESKIDPGGHIPCVFIYCFLYIGLTFLWAIYRIFSSILTTYKSILHMLIKINIYYFY